MTGSVEFVTEREPPRRLVVALANSLNERGVNYCHWKSNHSLDRALAGHGDLDLLVSRGDQAKFHEALAQLRFARVEAPSRLTVPGTEHFYGYDREADDFVHIHAHFQMILGHDRTKNYRLPVEDAYLSSSELRGLLRVPDLNFEYIVFVIRMTLKYSVWDEIAWNAIRGQTTKPKPSERVEFDHFVAQVDPSEVSKLLARHFPYLDDKLFDACVGGLQGKASVRRRIVSGRLLQHALRAHNRYLPLLDVGLRAWRRVTVTARRRLGGSPRRRLASGGALIAVIGGDGSGKSTALDEVYRWLRTEFDVRRIHLGKPPRSITTVIVRGLLAGLSRVMKGRRHGENPNAIDRYRPVFWMVCKARDRFHSYRKVRRFTVNGGLVVSDRYPHPSLRLMDAPQIEQMIDSSIEDSPFVRRMMRVEKRYHEAIGLPELIVALKVDPEIAVARKTSESAESVRRRGAEIWNMTWADDSVQVIDASQSKEQVAKELKSLIWARLS